MIFYMAFSDIHLIRVSDTLFRFQSSDVIGFYKILTDSREQVGFFRYSAICQVRMEKAPSYRHIPPSLFQK